MLKIHSTTVEEKKLKFLK